MGGRHQGTRAPGHQGMEAAGQGRQGTHHRQAGAASSVPASGGASGLVQAVSAAGPEGHAKGKKSWALAGWRPTCPPAHLPARPHTCTTPAATPHPSGHHSPLAIASHLGPGRQHGDSQAGSHSSLVGGDEAEQAWLVTRATLP